MGSRNKIQGGLLHQPTHDLHGWEKWPIESDELPVKTIEKDFKVMQLCGTILNLPGFKSLFIPITIYYLTGSVKKVISRTTGERLCPRLPRESPGACAAANPRGGVMIHFGVWRWSRLNPTDCGGC